MDCQLDPMVLDPYESEQVLLLFGITGCKEEALDDDDEVNDPVEESPRNEYRSYLELLLWSSLASYHM